MPYRTLGDFLDELETAGELARIGIEVDTDLEIAEITRRVAETGGPGLLFQNVKGVRAAVATNLLGTERRICRALGVQSLAETTERVRDSLGGEATGGWFDRLKLARESASDRWQPRPVKTGACQQVVRLASDVDLTALPALRNWPDEPGRFIHAGLLLSCDPDRGERHVDRCDLQVLDKTRLAVLLSPRQPIARLLARVRKPPREKGPGEKGPGEKGTVPFCSEDSTKGDSPRRLSAPMPVAVVLGGDPAYRLMAGSPLAAALSPLPLGGLLRGQPIELVKCRGIDLGVPADADMVLEGYIDPSAAWVDAGPVGAAGGFYSVLQSAPVMNVAAVTERTSPICPAIIPGHSFGEPQALAHAAERIFLPLVQAVVPELVDYSLSDWGGSQRFLVLAIRKTYPHQARRVAAAIWGWEPLMTAKVIVIVDGDIEVHDARQVWSCVGAHVHPGRDVFFHSGPGHFADHAAPIAGLGQAMAIDATAKLPDEHPRPWPAALATPDAIHDLIRTRWRQYGLPPLPSPRSENAG
ncbi:MAG TPA: UbiD family decarboxylase [Pirellulales bacterium]|nr:UbiD family decarboxylase [Pirellulales bacterium]